MNTLTRLKTRSGNHKAKKWHFCKSIMLNIGGKLVLNFEATPAVVQQHAESLKSWQTSQIILECEERTFQNAIASSSIIYLRFKLIL